MLPLNWKGHREDIPDIEEPNEVFAMLCSVSYTHLRAHET